MLFQVVPWGSDCSPDVAQCLLDTTVWATWLAQGWATSPGMAKPLPWNPTFLIPLWGATMDTPYQHPMRYQSCCTENSLVSGVGCQYFTYHYAEVFMQKQHWAVCKHRDVPHETHTKIFQRGIMSQRTKWFSVLAWHSSLQLLEEQLVKWACCKCPLTQLLSALLFCCYLLYFSHLLNTLLTVIWRFTPYLFGYIKALHFQDCQSTIFASAQFT